MPPPHDTSRLRILRQQIEATHSHFIGFPGSTDFNYKHIYQFFDYLLNNVGDPFDQRYPGTNTKPLEQEVIMFFADLFRAPRQDRWGYVTSGGSEGNMYALYLGRELLPGALVYYSRAAHYSIAKNAHILQIPAREVAATRTDEMDYTDLARQLAAHPNKPAIVVATIGTTMSEARDNVAAIKKILAQSGVTQHFIHSDAALSGVYTALLQPRRYAFDLADGADSISISGHKFIGSPMPCGVVVTRKTHTTRVQRSGYYTSSNDSTITGSRSGHAPLLLWAAIQRWGVEGFRLRAEKGMRLAEYTLQQLQQIGWQAWRNPDSLTVVLAEPPSAIINKWQLATQDNWSHIICMPGVTKAKIDTFVADLDLIRQGKFIAKQKIKDKQLD